MPYSSDKDANKENPYSPSRAMSIEDQFLYRFSALEESVRSGFRRMDENFNRMQAEIHDRDLAVHSRITEVEKEMRDQFSFKRARIDRLVSEGAIARKEIEKRITELETWSKVLTARFAVILAVVTVVWTLAAPLIRGLIGIPNG